jgi:hypothetical protein
MKQQFDTVGRRMPAREEIARRAHEIYLERGSRPGHEVDDWLQAEYELMQLPVRKIAELKPSQSNKGRLSTSALVRLVQWALILGAGGITRFRH